MAALCRIELFGGLRIIKGEGTISRFRTQKTATLLAFLAHHRDRAHPREALTDMLWPWADPTAGRRSLSMALSSLRHQLEPPGVSAGAVLVTDRTNVQLNPEVVATDVSEFEAALSAAQGAPDRAAKETHLEEAIHLYRGEFLPGLYESWIPTEQVRLSELYVGAVVELAELLAGRGETTEAVSHLRRAIEAEPLREEPYRQVMRLHAEHGEPGAALAAYHELERVLAEELGEKPSTETRRLVKEMEELATRSSGADLRSTSLDPPRPARRRRKAELPTGTVTFLLVRADRDVVGQGPLDAQPLREEFKRHGGTEIETARAEHALAFGRAGDAVNCAAQCQLRAKAQGPSPTPFAMAVHTAEDAVGPDGSRPALHRAERLLAAAHPAQVLCSEATAGLLRYDLDGGLRLRDLGVYRLRGASASERVFQLDYPGGPETSAPLGAESGYAGHLPYQITRFFGRGQEIKQLEALLTGDARLVTLIGHPGCGKTRLAIEVAAQLVEPFKGNVWFVPLADLPEESDILDRALDPLGIRRSPQAAPLDQIVAALAEEAALIVFDNFEHLIESAGEVRTLLERSPDLHCLVTSRRRLGLTGEREFPVAPLPVPGEVSCPDLISNESVQLFVDRAQAVKPDFQLTDGNAETVAELCRRLEGVPLAIELAAARSHTQGLRQILDRLAKGEDLVARSRDAEERHRSLRSAVEWSYSLLSPELQRFWARLSVFRGGWTVEAAEAVCDEPQALDCLTELVECSLVYAEHGDDSRYRMLEMIRELAHDRLKETGECEVTNNKHLEHYHAFLHSFAGKWDGPDQRMMLDRVEADLDNFLAAMDRCDSVPEGVTTGLCLAGHLNWFWQARGHLRLGRATLDRALRRDPGAAPERQRASATNNAGILAFCDGDLSAAKALHEQALASWKSLGDKQNAAAALHQIADILVCQGSYVEARRLAHEALAINEKLGNRNWAAINLGTVSTVEFYLGNTQTARDLQRRCARIFRELGNLGDYHRTLVNLGEMNWECGELREAQDALNTAMTGLRELRNMHLLATAQLCLARVHASLDELEPAKALIGDSLPLVRKCEVHVAAADALHAGAVLLLAQARSLSEKEAQRALTRSGTLISAAHESMTKTGAIVPPSRNADRDLEMLRSRLGDVAFAAAWKEGKSMTVEHAMASLEDWLDLTQKTSINSAGRRASANTA